MPKKFRNLTKPFIVRKGKKFIMDSYSNSNKALVKRAKIFRKLGFNSFVKNHEKFYALYINRPAEVMRINR